MFLSVAITLHVLATLPLSLTIALRVLSYLLLVASCSGTSRQICRILLHPTLRGVFFKPLFYEPSTRGRNPLSKERPNFVQTVVPSTKCLFDSALPATVLEWLKGEEGTEAFLSPNVNSYAAPLHSFHWKSKPMLHRSIPFTGSQELCCNEAFLSLEVMSRAVRDILLTESHEQCRTDTFVPLSVKAWCYAGVAAYTALRADASAL